MKSYAIMLINLHFFTKFLKDVGTVRMDSDTLGISLNFLQVKVMLQTNDQDKEVRNVENKHMKEVKEVLFD